MAKNAVSSKKRITHIKNVTNMHYDVNDEFSFDMVDSIINDAMDSKTSSAKNKMKTRDSIDQTANKDLSGSTIDDSQAVKAAEIKFKRFSASRKFPLMEKSQKILKQLKHNRSMPKPKAHLQSTLISPQKDKSKEVSLKKRESSIKRSQKTATVTQNSVEIHAEEARSICRGSSCSSSDNEFENFVKKIKQSTRKTKQKKEYKNVSKSISKPRHIKLKKKNDSALENNAKSDNQMSDLKDATDNKHGDRDILTKRASRRRKATLCPKISYSVKKSSKKDSTNSKSDQASVCDISLCAKVDNQISDFEGVTNNKRGSRDILTKKVLRERKATLCPEVSCKGKKLSKRDSTNSKPDQASVSDLSLHAKSDNQINDLDGVSGNKCGKISSKKESVTLRASRRRDATLGCKVSTKDKKSTKRDSSSSKSDQVGVVNLSLHAESSMLSIEVGSVNCSANSKSLEKKIQEKKLNKKEYSHSNIISDHLIEDEESSDCENNYDSNIHEDSSDDCENNYDSNIHEDSSYDSKNNFDTTIQHGSSDVGEIEKNSRNVASASKVNPSLTVSIASTLCASESVKRDFIPFDEFCSSNINKMIDQRTENDSDDSDLEIIAIVNKNEDLPNYNTSSDCMQSKELLSLEAKKDNSIDNVFSTNVNQSLFTFNSSTDANYEAVPSTIADKIDNSVSLIKDLKEKNIVKQEITETHNPVYMTNICQDLNPSNANPSSIPKCIGISSISIANFESIACVNDSKLPGSLNFKHENVNVEEDDIVVIEPNINAASIKWEKEDDEIVIEFEGKVSPKEDSRVAAKSKRQRKNESLDQDVKINIAGCNSPAKIAKLSSNESGPSFLTPSLFAMSKLPCQFPEPNTMVESANNFEDLLGCYKKEYEVYNSILKAEASLEEGLKKFETHQANKLLKIRSLIQECLPSLHGTKESVKCNELKIDLRHSEVSSHADPNFGFPQNVLSLEKLGSQSKADFDRISPDFPGESLKKKCTRMTEIFLNNSSHLNTSSSSNLICKNEVDVRGSQALDMPASSKQETTFPNQKCAACGQSARSACRRCAKIFFCSDKCGVRFWNERHKDECGK